jgi:hypothetical protein
MSVASVSAGAEAPAGVVGPTSLDSEILWVPAEPARVISVPTTRPLDAREFVMGWATTWLSRPIVVMGSSPDPAGREVAVVSQALHTTLTLALGLGVGTNVVLATPFTLHQSGAGEGALVSQNGPALSPSAMRDPRLGMSFARRWAGENAHGGVRTRLELKVPGGDQGKLAGERGVTLLPAVVGDLCAGRGYFAAQLGARLRQSSRFADVVVGSQLDLTVGLSLELLPRELVTIGAELRALPSLVGQEVETHHASGSTLPSFVPAEWTAVVNLVPVPAGTVGIQLGGGGGLPLSRVRGVDGSTRWASGVTTPEMRIFAGIRYGWKPPGARAWHPRVRRSVPRRRCGRRPGAGCPETGHSE